MNVAVALFTRDLRVRDNPMLVAACEHAEAVVPLFVVDDAIVGGRWSSPNRCRFLAEALDDLDASLQARSNRLVVRRGEWVHEVVAVAVAAGATVVHVVDDVSAAAQQRIAALRVACASRSITVVTHPGVTVVEPGAVRPAGGNEFKVFTPYYRKWSELQWRSIVRAPDVVPASPGAGALQSVDYDDLRATGADLSPDVARGGETAGTARLREWTRSLLVSYEGNHDDLAGDATSRIAAYLHFGCLSPLEVATRLRDRPGAEAFIRQLCWRDFYHQILAARPETSRTDFRDRGDVWNHDPDGFAAWSEGRTGYPIVDAAMRQLRVEGFVHNRARMVVASFLTKDLYIDWRVGAAHFMRWLLDGDVANNQLNWQWVAGTGSDTNPNRIFNPLRQAERFDPTGEYTRRYVEELRDVPAPEIHDPAPLTRAACGYPLAIVDHHEAIAAYRARP